MVRVTATEFEKLHGRPLMLSDKLGYPKSVGDEDWETKHKKNYVKQPDGTWKRKCQCSCNCC